MAVEWEMAFRLLLSGILGGLIGYEREHQHKSAGLRTHILVCMGACLIMILSEKVYLQAQGLTNADPARLAAQVVSGMGFLGAGSIIKEGPNVRGLTTAASLWVVSGVGLAVGFGYFLGAFVTTALVFLTLTILARIENKGHGVSLYLEITTVDRPGQIGQVASAMGRYGLSIRDIKIISHGELLIITFLLHAAERINWNGITAEVADIAGVKSVKRE